jgi:hypothetical protein
VYVARKIQVQAYIKKCRCVYFTVTVVRTVQVPPVHPTRGWTAFDWVSHLYYLPPIHSLVALSSRFINHHQYITSYRFYLYLTTINSCYWLKCPTVFLAPPISSFIPNSKWVPLSSYSPEERLPPVRQTFVYSLIFYPPSPHPRRYHQSHTLYIFLYPSVLPLS